MSSPSIGIVGSETLLGKELRESLRVSSLKPSIQLIGADDEEAGKVLLEEEEAAVITPLDERNLASADIVMLAGSRESSRKAWSLLGQRNDTPVIDLTRSLEDIGSARLTAPMAGTGAPGSGGPLLIAHPAAIALALFLPRLSHRQPRRTVVDIFEPASEYGQPAIDELHQQTMKLFAFQNLPKAVFDTQIAYAMLARYGADSQYSLAQAEVTIEHHLASLLASTSSPMPSLRLIQAPVFHGYSMSVWAEFESAVTAEELGTDFFVENVDMRGEDEEVPTNVGSAGQQGIAVGDVRADRNNPRAFWFWLTADNLKLSVDNAIQVAETLWAD